LILSKWPTSSRFEIGDIWPVFAKTSVSDKVNLWNLFLLKRCGSFVNGELTVRRDSQILKPQSRRNLIAVFQSDLLERISSLSTRDLVSINLLLLILDTSYNPHSFQMQQGNPAQVCQRTSASLTQGCP
jgi:hypothetical protein